MRRSRLSLPSSSTPEQLRLSFPDRRILSLPTQGCRPEVERRAQSSLSISLSASVWLKRLVRCADQSSGVMDGGTTSALLLSKLPSQRQTVGSTTALRRGARGGEIRRPTGRDT